MRFDDDGRTGFRPDRWQRDILRSPSKRVIMLASRQSGKSLTAAAIALREALLSAPALVEHAIRLSHEKYCSASIMLGKMAQITKDFEIVED